MKILIYFIVISFSVLMPNAQYTPGEEEVIEYVAGDFDVSESDITLISPNIVDVDLGTSSTQGVASFHDCGNDCTRLLIVFDDRTLDFMIIEEMGGM